MHDAQKPKSEIIRKWMYVFAAVAVAGPLGYYLEKPLTTGQLSVIVGFAAGALMAFITEELIPQAYKKAESHIGLSTTFGFLLGFLLFYFLRA